MKTTIAPHLTGLQQQLKQCIVVGQYLNMLQSLEEKIDLKFSEFSAKLRKIDDRIKLLESANS